MKSQHSRIWVETESASTIVQHSTVIIKTPVLLWFWRVKGISKCYHRCLENSLLIPFCLPSHAGQCIVHYFLQTRYLDCRQLSSSVCTHRPTYFFHLQLLTFFFYVDQQKNGYWVSCFLACICGT